MKQDNTNAVNTTAKATETNETVNSVPTVKEQAKEVLSIIDEHLKQDIKTNILPAKYGNDSLTGMAVTYIVKKTTRTTERLKEYTMKEIVDKSNPDSKIEFKELPNGNYEQVIHKGIKQYRALTEVIDKQVTELPQRKAVYFAPEDKKNLGKVIANALDALQELVFVNPRFIPSGVNFHLHIPFNGLVYSSNLVNEDGYKVADLLNNDKRSLFYGSVYRAFKYLASTGTTKRVSEEILNICEVAK